MLPDSKEASAVPSTLGPTPGTVPTLAHKCVDYPARHTTQQLIVYLPGEKMHGRVKNKNKKLLGPKYPSKELGPFSRLEREKKN